jgi:hypothetical protein
MLRNLSLIFEDFSDNMRDVMNGLLGAKRDAFLKLMSIFNYKDESKLKQVYENVYVVF